MLEMESLLPLLEAIVSYIDDGVVIADDRSNVFYMNPSAHELLAVPANQPVRKLADVTSVELEGIFLSSHARRPLGAKAAKVEQRISLPNGGHRDLEFECCFAGEGTSKLRLLILRDVTQRRMLEAYLSRANADLITNDPRMIEVLHRVEQVAPQSATVLLQGESGTGKSHIARLIHRLSQRAGKPLIEVNCAAIPETLLENELFGHEKGAFTGASGRKAGRVELAHRGTLFLDEIAELAPSLQGKLLRLVQERQFERVGGVQTLSVDVRLVAATNRDLATAVERKEFREDLYFRLSVFPVTIPPLRRRRGDILILAEAFLERFAGELGRRGLRLSEAGRRALLDHPWPGNVRELQNALERAVLLCDGLEVGPQHLQLAPPGAASATLADVLDLSGPLEDVVRRAGERAEREAVEQALKASGGRRPEAAERLGLTAAALARRLKALGLDDEGRG